MGGVLMLRILVIVAGALLAYLIVMAPTFKVKIDTQSIIENFIKSYCVGFFCLTVPIVIVNSCTAETITKQEFALLLTVNFLFSVALTVLLSLSIIYKKE